MTQLRKLAHIELPTKREFVEVPCNCKPPVNHGPHYRETKPEVKDEA